MSILRRRPRILVVEDNFLLGDLICEVLRNCRTEPVGPIGTLDAALSMAEDPALDAAVLDIKVRGGTVYSVCRALQRRSVPFAFLTGVRLAIPDEFADVPCVGKPFAIGSLEEAVSKILRAAFDDHEPPQDPAVEERDSLA